MDGPLVYQLSRQRQRWVATFGREKRWKHLSVKPSPRWDLPSFGSWRLLEDYQVIGQVCKAREGLS